MELGDLMPHTATIWAPGRNDGFGKLDYSDVVPVTVSCRWQNVQELFRDAQGRELLSNAVVYTTTAVVPDSFVVQGLSTLPDPLSVVGAYKVLQVTSSPSLDGATVLYKVTL